MVHIMHWNQHLFMLEELYLEKENLESQLSNRYQEIEKLRELTKRTEKNENILVNRKNISTQTIENNTQSIQFKKENFVLLTKVNIINN